MVWKELYSLAIYLSDSNLTMNNSSFKVAKVIPTLPDLLCYLLPI